MKSLRIKLPIAAYATLILAPLFAAADPLGTTFIYQGRLTNRGGTANNLYDFQFVLCDAATMDASAHRQANALRIFPARSLLGHLTSNPQSTQ